MGNWIEPSEIMVFQEIFQERYGAMKLYKTLMRIFHGPQCHHWMYLETYLEYSKGPQASHMLPQWPAKKTTNGSDLIINDGDTMIHHR